MHKTYCLPLEFLDEINLWNYHQSETHASFYRDSLPSNSSVWFESSIPSDFVFEFLISFVLLTFYADGNVWLTKVDCGPD